MEVRSLQVLLTGISNLYSACSFTLVLLCVVMVNTLCFCFRFVYIWDTTSRRILYKLPGHAGSVNEVSFHPEEPIGKNILFLSLEKSFAFTVIW